MKSIGRLLGGASALALCVPSLAQEAPATVTGALKASTTQLHLRLRYEDVDEDLIGDSQATTLLTRLSFTSGNYRGFGLAIEMDDTTELIDEDYKTWAGDPRPAPVIADPEVTEVNQAYFSYATDRATAKLGRQRILLDNQRFVGGVGWRQDEQTYDGFSVAAKPGAGFDAFYAYISKANRIFAEYDDHNHQTHLINAKLKTTHGDLVGYAYLIDNETAINLSNSTYGLRWQGKIRDTVSYTLEYAKQSEAGDAADYSADYALAEIGGGLPLGQYTINIKAGYELLGSDDGARGFITPLATLHAFQGWTDKFLSTPPAGIEDVYFSFGGQAGPVNIGVVYHDFSADFGGADYGSEIGLVATTTVGPFALTAKFADYHADEFSTDTRKLWLMAAATY